MSLKGSWNNFYTVNHNLCLFLRKQRSKSTRFFFGTEEVIINKIKLKTNLHKSDGQFSVEHENGLVVPRILAVQVDAVQDVLDQRVGDDRQQDSVLKTKDQLEKYQDKRQKF